MTWKMHFPMYVYGMVIETPVLCFCVAAGMVAVYGEKIYLMVLMFENC